MKKKIGHRLGAAVCLAFLVAACGGGTNPNSYNDRGGSQGSQPQRSDHAIKVVEAPLGRPDPDYDASSMLAPDSIGPTESKVHNWPRLGM